MVLPLDLEREVLEFAAERYPEAVMDMLVLARRTHAWLEPFLYRRVCLSAGESLSPVRQVAFFRAARTKPASLLACGVRFLRLDFSMHWPPELVRDALHALPLCAGIVWLCVNSDEPYDTHIVVFNAIPLQALKLRRCATFLAECIPALGKSTARLPEFSLLTHLFFMERSMSPEVSAAVLAFTTELPALTHLAFIFENLKLPKTTLQEILAPAGCRRLQILAFLGFTSRDIPLTEQWAAELPIQDQRIVVVMTWEWDDFMRDGTLGGKPSFWDKAEAFLAGKAAGTVPKDSFWVCEYTEDDQGDDDDEWLNEHQ
ncbi:hypothetical protein HMN09_00930300 [Mycena chlorophos]|uniref:Uncharacterized protein n=1 Tax=Mycena chlorophos TaxID=658473 RepID=A0A8H6SIW4_MYCCL|nr:hypothetical protein HMN09_00930300 [Mycena chlorophos]